MSGIEIGNLESLHTLVFSSLEFLFRYLPLFLILFYAVPKRFRMFVLFAFSLILYALGDPVHVLISLRTIPYQRHVCYQFMPVLTICQCLIQPI